MVDRAFLDFDGSTASRAHQYPRFGEIDKERSMPEEVKAHITGVVFQITSKPGDAVAAGDPSSCSSP